MAAGPDASDLQAGGAPADIQVVPWNSGPQPAPAWLYTRDQESVRIEVLDQGTTFGLLVHGPGRRRRFLECPDPWAVIECQIAQEAHLLAQGYALERFTADRRRTLRQWGRDERDREDVPCQVLPHRAHER